MMVRLENYINNLIKLSPLISNLFVVRDFLTNGKVNSVMGVDES
jgi:hypothetical protein